MLVVVEHAEEAPTLLGKCTGQGHGIDRAVDDKERDPGYLHYLLAVLNNDLR